MQEKEYGKILIVESLCLDDARKLIEEGTLGILITQCKVDDAVKELLSKSQIVLYDGVTPENVDSVRKLICSGTEEW